MNRRAIGALLLLLAATAVAPTEHAVAQANRVDDLIREEMQRQNIPGLSLAVLQNGEIVKVDGYGLADIANETPARSQAARVMFPRPQYTAGITEL